MIAAASSIVSWTIFSLAGITLAIMAFVKKANVLGLDQKRVLELQDLSSKLGFNNFSAGRDEGFAAGWGFLNHLAQGQKRYAFNILRGTYRGQTVFVFDYHYQSANGRDNEEKNCTMLMLVVREFNPNSRNPSPSQLTITPARESMLEKMDEIVFGSEDRITFDSIEFSKAFCVRSKDSRFAYAACNPQLIEYLLGNRDLEIEIQGPVILLAFEPQVPVGQIEFNLERLIEICSRLPQYLFTQNV